MVLGGIRIGQVDGVWVVRVLCYVGKVQAESLAETAKLDFALVLQAELEGLLGNLLHGRSRYLMYERANAVSTNLVDRLQPRIVFQSLQSRPVALPQELEPWGDQGPVGSVLGLVSADRAEQDALRSLACLEIVDIECNGLVSLFLGLLHLRV